MNTQVTSAVSDVATAKKGRGKPATTTAAAAPTAAPKLAEKTAAPKAAGKPGKSRGIVLKGGKNATQARADLRAALKVAKGNTKAPAKTVRDLQGKARGIERDLKVARKQLGLAYVKPQADTAMQKQRLKDRHADVAQHEARLKAANKDVVSAQNVHIKAKAGVEAVKAKIEALEQTIAAAKAG
jgi:hypothetical protein